MSAFLLHRRALSLCAGLLTGLFGGLVAVAPSPASADELPYISVQGPEEYTSFPVTSTESSPPLVMLTLSRDHQLHYKAYNDYSDLDGDLQPETTYKHSVDYYGYFDSYKCYTYDTANHRFNPASITSTKYCSGQWSGNFLNWATMTRMDAVRKLLYGGLRSTDSSSLTVLERGYLPTDGHSFAKYYNGSDASQLTPFTPAATNPTSSYLFTGLTVSATALSGVGVSTNTSTYGGATKYSFTIPTTGLSLSVGDQVRIQSTTSSLAVFGGVYSLTATLATIYVYPQSWVGTGTILTATLTNLSRTGLSICNLTPGGGTGGNLSQSNTDRPRIRVASGNYELWGANEQRQCQWRGGNNSLTAFSQDQQSSFLAGFRSNGNRSLFSGLNASAENPLQTERGLGTGIAQGEYVARVAACVTGLEGTERCKAYPAAETSGAVKKPIGLLQVYGDGNRIKFGMVTPSYQKNVSGGVLRKALPGPTSSVGLSDEINVASDGSFTGAAGIISNLNKLRIYGYKYDSGDSYGASGADGCTYQRTGIAKGNTGSGTVVSEGNCSSWGNPLGEAYIETLRYLAGEGPADTDFVYGSGSRDATLGLSVVSSWNDPIDETNFCSSLNVIAFNASVSSYDTDSADQFSNLAGSPSISTLTNQVGTLEGLTGRYFVGKNGTSADNSLCTAKDYVNLASAKGICPEAASLDGGWLMAGAAYFAKTQPIRDDIDTGDNAGNVLTVDTYGIALATNVPRIEVRDPADPSIVLAEILPLYRLTLPSGVGGGAIVDFRIVEENVAAGTGRYYVNWEDSSQGGDYDQDLWGTISYQLSADKTQVSVTTDAVSASTNNPQGFGYIMGGTNKDGAHFHSGIYDFDYTDPTTVTVRVGGSTGTVANGTTFASTGGINSSGGCVDCELGDPATTVTYTLGGSDVGSLEEPLFYASKFGGFSDTNSSDSPDLVSEWDSRQADGSSGSDGLPDNYFFVSNPNALESSLQRAFSDILARVASGTAAAVVANAREGEGAIYQALYEPVRPDTDTEGEVQWIGTLHALWVDDAGYLREDNGNAVLDDYDTDPAVELYFDEDEGVTRIRRFDGDPGTETATSTPDSLENLGTLWNAREELSSLGDVLTQRTYGSATAGRYIFTWLDLNQNGEVDDGEQLPFTEATFSDRFGILNAENQNDADSIVRFVRGEEQDDLRNRTLNYDGDDAGTRETQRLGDIVNSTPTVVGTPQESFDLLYNDETYGAFREQYRFRRQMIYVGANDGLLHAFNGGFYNSSEKAFETQSVLGTEPNHPLGAELWAYAPYNLLPHLTWTTSTDYAHTWYVDGKPRVFDARVFAEDADHPYGWGTLMVVGFRLGGGELDIVVDDADNSFSDFALDDGDTLTTRPVFVLFDVTNPEAEPRLLGEIADPNPSAPTLGFTTSYPTVVGVRDAGASPSSIGTGDRWYLIFGNGPDNLDQATSARSGHVYVYDLEAMAYVDGYDGYNLGSQAVNSFVGDPVTADWDLNFKADAVYFGTGGGTPEEPTGSLFKIDVDERPDATLWTEPELLVDPGNPILTTPSVTFDEAGNKWIYAGTGRFYTNPDKTSSDQQSVFGVIDQLPGSSTDYDALVDVTDAVVDLGGTVVGVTDVDSVAELEFEAADAGGWRLNFEVPDAAARNVSQTSLFNEILYVTAFTPSESLCTGEGSSELYGLYYKTGTTRSDTPVFGCQTSDGSCEATTDITVRSVDLGSGLAASPTLQVGGDVRDTRGLTVFSQTSTGAIGRTEGSLTDSARSGEIDWREIRE